MSTDTITITPQQSFDEARDLLLALGEAARANPKYPATGITDRLALWVKDQPSHDNMVVIMTSTIIMAVLALSGLTGGKP